MKLYQSINISTILFIGAALTKGLVDTFSKVNTSIYDFLVQNPSIFCLSLFILGFKIKTMLDDQQHFGEVHQDSGSIYRHLGFILAVLSWILLGIAAYYISFPKKSAELLIFSLVISTVWIAIHIIEILLDKNKERKIKEIVISLTREKWLLINIGYILLLGTYRGWLDPVIATGNIVVLYSLLGLLFIDYVTSRPKTITNTTK